jgi:DEAD/DEAH box helicase domain-containing protein
MNFEDLISGVADACERAGINVLETQEIENRVGVLSSIPAHLEPRLFETLSNSYSGGLYNHQSEAIEAITNGQDVCLATPTASGKSLVFMSAAADLILKTPNAVALALYPAKALIQDQISKWTTLLNPLGISIGYIDGSIDTLQRPSILRNNRVILMTPDVAQAWLMANLAKPEVAEFISTLKYLILDEAHIYSGVFGSNMAYLIRRMQAVSGLERVISSTATIADAEEFIEKLTGRKPIVFDESQDASPSPSKAVLLTSPSAGNFKELSALIVELSRRDIGKFIAFGDSRKLVETFVAAAKREKNSEDSEEIKDDEVEAFEIPREPNVLPYRAGYEEEDRQRIQVALEKGELRGVVATSGLELGIDIGEINTVVMLGTPPTIQAFRQRLGRAGRRNPGVCVLVDTKGLIASLPGGLTEYLTRTSERAWLYLENRYIQYTNALCAASEAASSPAYRSDPFRSLPPKFLQLLQNELEPTETLPDDLFNLKQRAQVGPHLEFPIRSGIEKNFKVRQKEGPNIYPLGTLSHSQMLREGFPGAVYYYMAKPYRVYAVNARHGEIDARREHYYTTRPITQNMVFPKFPNGVFQMVKSDAGFVAEAQLQVSERVLGFQEIRGGNKVVCNFERGCVYSERPLMRMFETTGVCWSVPNTQSMTEQLALVVMEAFCLNYGIHTRDVGIGTFHSNVSPIGGLNCKGICIYDATNGSLRLTEQLADDFGKILEESVDLLRAQTEFDANLALNIAFLKELYSEMKSATFETSNQIPEAPTETSEWVEVFATGEKVLYKNGGQVREMYVHGYRYTPAGLMYDITEGEGKAHCITRASEVLAASDDVKTVHYNLYTGDIRRGTSTGAN